MTEPKWLLPALVDAMHDMQLAEHGGAAGVRDRGLLASALDRPQNAYHYGERDLHNLAAAYAFGLAKNHPYVDGNKRTAFLAAVVFLRINGWAMTASEVAATQAVLDLAGGDSDQEAFAVWLRANTSAI